MSPESQEPVLNIRSLNFQYPGDIEALRSIDFQINHKERVGIVGPSGAGKSTLLLHFNGLLPEKLSPSIPNTDNASVSIMGKSVSEENIYQIRQWVGLLFQDPDDQLFCPTVEEDIAFGPLNMKLSQEEVQKRISESLSAVGLKNYEKRKTMQLSVGERKRVCLAGILACQPSILVLDEPTSNLDPRARRRLLEILQNFEGCQIIATHDLEFVVEHCDRVILLDEGEIHADGTPKTVLSDSVLMKEHGLEVPLSIQWKMRS
jgi:cobalt/nickel transport system ATP-binding protein